MDDMFAKLDAKILRKTEGVSGAYDTVWNKVWDELSRFAEANLDEAKLNEFIKTLSASPASEMTAVVTEAFRHVPMGFLRLEERLNYVVDIIK